METQSDSTKDMSQQTDVTLTVEESKPKRMEWTNEKHSMYLKSMEASFVDHLYGSLASLGWNSKNDKPSKSKSSKQKHAIHSGQYKVFQDGCWTKMDFSRDAHEPQQNKTNESGAVLASPWIKHYKPTGRHQMRLNSDLQGNTLNQSPASNVDLCLKDSDDSITEGMDQNFIDEDPEEGKSSKEHSTKRTKISISAGTTSDQVVPFGVCAMSDDLAQNLMESMQ